MIGTLITHILAAIAKTGGFLITGSASLLAEAAHSAAAVGNQTLLLVGIKRSSRGRRAATPTHPFGYGREHYFWSFVAALVLLSLGAAFAIYFGILRIREPHELVTPYVALIILGGAAIAKGVSFGAVILAAIRSKGDASWWRFVRHATQPHLPVAVIGEIGALVGLLMAATAVTVAMVTGNPLYDAIGTLAIGVLMAIVAAVLAIQMRSLLIGESANPMYEQGIAAAIEIEPSVTRLVHLRTQHIGPEELLVGAKIELVDGLDLAEVTEVVNHLESSVRRAVPAARIIYLEPDVFRTTLPRDLNPPPLIGSSPATDQRSAGVTSS